jgi:hypothetical protein
MVTISNAYETILGDESIQAGEHFGYAVGISGDYAIVGAKQDCEDQIRSGAAYIYHREGHQWIKETKIKASEPVKDEYFGYTVDIEGSTAIIGTYFGNGAAYIFEKSSDRWVQKKRLSPCSDGNAHFGQSVSISGNTIVVGAPQDGNSDQGSAYIYVKENEEWKHQDTIQQNSYGASQRFGYSVSIDGDYVAVGIPYAVNSNYYNGHVLVFFRSQGSWSKIQDIPYYSSSHNYFGFSVSISGQYLIGGCNNQNYAYIYKLNGQSFREIKRITPNDTASHFGNSVSISGSYAIVSASYDTDYLSSQGSAFIYKLIDDNCYFHSKILASDSASSDLFGCAVSITDDYAIAGAYNKNNSTGSSYLYTISEIPQYTISGYVMDSSDRGLIDTNMVIDNLPTVKTDQYGHFSIDVGLNYSGSLTAKNENYKFRPGSRTYEFVNNNISGQYFFLEAHTISGIVTDPNGTPIPGVEIIFSDNVSGTSSIFTNNDGYYSYQLYANFSGTAFPKGMGYKYDPIRIPYDNLSENKLNQNYTGYRFTIAGYCMDESGQPIANVQVTFSPGNMQTTTDENGFYSQDVPYLWTGSLTLEKVGVDFQNQSKEFTAIGTNLFGTDFIGKEKKYAVSGTVRDQDQLPLENARICFSNTGNCITTDSNGHYEKIMPFGSDFYINVDKTGYLIAPERLFYTQLSANQPKQDYTATIIRYVVSGQIIDKDDNGNPMSNVSVMFDDHEEKTDDQGMFRWESTYGDQVVIQPEIEGYHFTPSQIPVDLLSSNIPDIRFTAERERFMIRGRVVDNLSQGASGVTVKLANKEMKLSDEDGYYEFEVEYGYIGSVQIFKEFYKPTPVIRDVEYVKEDVYLNEFDITTDDPTPKSILVYPDLYHIPAESQSFSFEVMFSPDTLDWDVLAEKEWIQVTRTNGKVQVRCEQNTSQMERIGEITVREQYAANSPQKISLIQAGQPEPVVGPGWNQNFDPTVFEYHLNLTATIKDDMGKYLDDNQNMLAAFCGDELRGVAHPTETSMGKRYFLMVHSHQPADEEISFKFYDSNNDRTNVNIKYPITFESEAIIGNIIEPHELAISDYFVRIGLNKYWSWITVNVINNDMSVGSVLKSLGLHGIMIVGQEGFCQYDPINDKWNGSFNKINPLHMYKILTNDPCMLEYSGNALDIPKTPINLSKGWNWLGYLPATAMSLDQALASITTNAIMITGQNGFAFCTEKGWVGSLTMLEPNHGYKIQMAQADQLIYPETPQIIPQTRSLRKRTRQTNSIWQPDTSQYEHQTTVTAQVYLNDSLIGSQGDALAGFVNGECRGIAKPVETLYGAMYFLQIWGETDDIIALRFYHAAETQVYDLDLSWSFVPDASDGNINAPKQIHLDKKTCGNQPDWTVDVTQYQHQAMLTAIVGSEDNNLCNECDMLAAFVDNSCRGVAYAQDTGGYGKRFFLSVWGDEAIEMTLKYYQSADGNVYTVGKPFMFHPMANSGTVDSPEQLTMSSNCDECKGDLAKCRQSLDSCYENWDQCNINLIGCEHEKDQYRKDLIDCQFNLSKCEMELAACNSYAITLTDGWHLISGVSSAATPTTNPPDCIASMFEYRNGKYEQVHVITPTRGVWVKIKEECTENGDGYVWFYVDGN